jgi:hypothetical protein
MDASSDFAQRLSILPYSPLISNDETLSVKMQPGSADSPDSANSPIAFEL